MELGLNVKNQMKLLWEGVAQESGEVRHTSTRQIILNVHIYFNSADCPGGTFQGNLCCELDFITNYN